MKIKRFNIEKAKAENGDQITLNCLYDILVIAKSKEDFIRKVTYGWTNETSELPGETVEQLELFWEQA